MCDSNVRGADSRTNIISEKYSKFSKLNDAGEYEYKKKEIFHSFLAIVCLI